MTRLDSIEASRGPRGRNDVVEPLLSLLGKVDANEASGRKGFHLIPTPNAVSGECILSEMASWNQLIKDSLGPYRASE